MIKSLDNAISRIVLEVDVGAQAKPQDITPDQRPEFVGNVVPALVDTITRTENLKSTAVGNTGVVANDFVGLGRNPISFWSILPLGCRLPAFSSSAS